MEKEQVQKALEDLTEIKRVFENTGRDFTEAVKLLFIAGMFFVAESVISSLNILATWNFFSENVSVGRQVAVVSYISGGLSLIGFFATLTTYLFLRRKQKRFAKGLGLQLLDIWGGFLIGISLYAYALNMISLYVAEEQVARYVSIPHMFFMAAMPLMLFVTGILVNKRSPKLLALLYILVSLTTTALSRTVDLAVGSGMTMQISVGSLLGTGILPGIFLIGAGLLTGKKKEEETGNEDG